MIKVRINSKEQEFFPESLIVRSRYNGKVEADVTVIGSDMEVGQTLVVEEDKKTIFSGDINEIKQEVDFGKIVSRIAASYSYKRGESKI